MEIPAPELRELSEDWLPWLRAVTAVRRGEGQPL
jgi:hypothetical protein